MVKTLRKGAIVRKKEQSPEERECWGELYEVYHKEGNFVKCISLKKPYFGVALSCGINAVELVNK